MKKLAYAALIATLPASAMAFDDTDAAAVQAATTGFQAAFTSGDYATILDYLPPNLLEFMSSQMNGMSPADLKASMAQQMSAFMSDISIDQVNMNVSGATSGDTSAGQGYAFIPTTTRVTAEGKTQTMRTQTLALEDGGRWYLVRIEQPQQYELVKQVYPEFAGIPLP